MNTEIPAAGISKIPLKTKLFHSPVLIDSKEDIWLEKCPRCKRIYRDRRHGYSNFDFLSGEYIECPYCHFKIIFPRGWK